MHLKHFRYITLVVIGFCMAHSVYAQHTIITGKVLDAADSTPLNGVSVSIKGTEQGITTKKDGSFSIRSATAAPLLVVSYVGYSQQETTTTDSFLTIYLNKTTNEMNEVVVVALGLKRQKAALGYAVSEVSGKDLTQAREVNVLNSLEGKVAGVNVSGIAGGPGASSNVVIRGISSLTQTNQPLYVINGIPIENQPNSSDGSQYSNVPDLGDAMSNINPDDIENISVLKGAAASALYGYRAKAGVILITTKTAKSNSIELNSNYVAEKVMDLTDWQYVYGQGANNLKPTSQLVAFQSGQSSWGGKLDGSPVVQFDGDTRPYAAQKNNLQNFYRTGGTFTNTLALDRTFNGGSIRFSASNLTNRSIVPNSGINRQTFDLSANYNLTPRFLVDVHANYILEQAKNRPLLSDPSGNSNYNVMFLPTSVDVRTLEKATNPDGSELAYSPTVNATNPWFAAEKFVNNTERNRLISSVRLRYNFDNGLFLQGRAGMDNYNDHYLSVVPTGTAYRPKGSMSEYNSNYRDLNADLLAGKEFKVSPDLTITPNLGASYRRTKSAEYENHGETFLVPFVYNILNTSVKTVYYLPSDQEVQSVYGTLDFAYKNYLFLTGSGRNDWFSTLATPGTANKVGVFYPSVSGSFVFSELLKPNDWFSYGKLRAGYAEVGQATGPYQTQLSYIFAGTTFNGLPQGLINNSDIPNSSLKPSLAKELEIGTELGFFHNRLNLDLTWYNKKSSNEILSAPASIASGYGGAILNIGQLQNKGWEVLLSGTPVKGSRFTWKTAVNGSVNNNKVLALADNQSSLGVGTSSTAVGFIQQIVGLPANQIMAYDYKYDSAGNVVNTASGVPARGQLKPYGSAYAKWMAGFSNDFYYRNFHLSFLIDGKFGGKLFSGTDYRGYTFGLSKATLVNREGTFGNNLDAATYYSTLASNVSKLFVEDASFIKFRSVVLEYTFPAGLFGKGIKGASLSIVGRNLFYLMRKTDNVDPESSFSPSAYGLELGGVPSTRTFGANLNLKF